MDPASVATPAPQLEKPAASSKPVSDTSTLSTAGAKKRSVKENHPPAVESSKPVSEQATAVDKKRKVKESHVTLTPEPSETSTASVKNVPS